MADIRISDPEASIRKHNNGDYTLSIQQRGDVLTEVKVITNDIEDLIKVFAEDIYEGMSLSAINFENGISVWMPHDKAKEIHEVLLNVTKYGVEQEIL